MTSHLKQTDRTARAFCRVVSRPAPGLLFDTARSPAFVSQTENAVPNAFLFGMDFTHSATGVSGRSGGVDGPGALSRGSTPSYQGKIRALSNHSAGTQGSRRPSNQVGRWLRRFGGAGIGAGAGAGFLPFDPLGTAQAARPWPLSALGGFLTKKTGIKRVLILMSNTGGGHKASADALKSGFEQLYRGKYEINVVDLWMEHTPYPFNQLPKTYSFLVNNAWMWRILYFLSNPRFMHGSGMAMAATICYDRVSECIELYNPDLIVSVHPLMQHVPMRVLIDRMRRGVQKPIAFATVVTDFTTCHNSWFHPGVTQCFVPTEFCAELARRMNLKDDQITVHGLPIRPDFSKSLPAKSTLRKRLGMDKEKPAVLLVGGGEGMGKLEQIVDAIAAEVGSACQVVVICGRNKKLVKRLEEREYPEGMRVFVNGFVNNMNEWMSACDAVVTKAGPGTIAEALICGTPILLNGFVPGQEEGNIPYVLDNKVGAFEKQPNGIANVIKDWFTAKQDILKEMSQRAKSLGRPEALFRIVEDLARFADHPYLYHQTHIATQIA